MLILGIIIGIVVSILIVLTMTFFRAGIEKRIKILETRVENYGPKPKGFVFEAPDEADEIREEIIQQNREKGRDTPLSDLIDK